MNSSSHWTLVLIFCCLALTTLISYKSTQGLIEDNGLVLHTQKVLEEVLEISVNFRTAESRQRGYILTGEPQYLDNYQQSLQEVDQHLQSLKKRVIDNPARESDVQKLEQLIKKRIDIMQSVLKSYQSEGVEKGRQALIHGGGLQAMNEFTTLADDIEAEEKKLLEFRSISSAQSRTYALNGLLIGGIFTTTLVLFSFYLLLNDLRRRQQVAQDLANSRANLEARVVERTQELEHSNRELQEFAYIASHDLQEPLRKIQVFGDRLKQKANDKLDNAAMDHLERMQNAAKRMQTLINDLLQFSRVTANSTTDDFVQVDLNLIIQDVLSDLEGSIEHYGGKINVDLLPVIQADPLQVRQLLQNILSNALKFQRTGIPPEISVKWQNQNMFPGGIGKSIFYEIAIADNGIGIDPQYSEKIFVPFQRLHGKNEYDGTGIGLAVCRKIIEKHHGYIHVLPAPGGQGAVFLLGFPLK